MFQHMLIPLDGTSDAATVLPLGAELARATGAGVVLARVVPDQPEDWAAVAAAGRYLAGAADSGDLAGLRVDTAVGHGQAAAQICALAEKRHADLIVMATHGREGLERALLGSVTEDVLRQSVTPVLVLRLGNRPPSKIETLLVPLDGTAGSRPGVEFARLLAKASRARIVLLQVVPALPRYGRGRFIEPGFEEHARLAAQRAVDAVVHELMQGGVGAEARAVIGAIGPTICETADAVDADLIVMSTAGLIGPSRALLGSVAHEVTRSSPRPVLLIRRALSTSDEEPPGERAEAEIDAADET